MKTLALLLPAILLTASPAHGQRPISQGQSFVVRVPSKVVVESPASTAESSAGSAETRLRLTATGTAGLTARFQARHNAGGNANVAQRPAQFTIRILSDPTEQWSLRSANESSRRKLTGNVMQLTSRAPGVASLVISSDEESETIEIMATIISNE